MKRVLVMMLLVMCMLTFLMGRWITPLMTFQLGKRR